MREEVNPNEIYKDLVSFSKKFEYYSQQIMAEKPYPEYRVRLQRKAPLIISHINQVLGAQHYIVNNNNKQSHDFVINMALVGGSMDEPHNFEPFGLAVTSILNSAIGSIKAGLWPPKITRPVLTIHDQVLKDRCFDLLQSPDKFDRVIREATLILEDRLRNKVSHERLSILIPDSSKQTGDNLVNKLLAPASPVLSISTDQQERAAFHKIMLGAFSYLRNPFHHKIDNTTEWSWSWSIVGFIDHLLYEIGNCEEIA